MQKVTTPLETMNKVLNVLAQRPYSEVVDIITELRESTEVIGDPDPEIEPADPEEKAA